MAEIVGIDDGRGDPALRGPADTDPDLPGRGEDRRDTAGEPSADADLADTGRDPSDTGRDPSDTGRDPSDTGRDPLDTGDDFSVNADLPDTKMDREIGRRR